MGLHSENTNKKATLLMKEYFEANTFTSTDRMVEEIMRELSLPQSNDVRQELKSLAQQIHEQIQDEGFDYENVADQSFPASDPPPVP